MKKIVNFCVYPKCRIGQKDGERKITFEFPKEKDLLAEWLEKIPFVNFGTIDIETAALCIDHFKKSDYSVKNKTYKLKSGAVPSVFEKSQLSELTDCCRFCLEPLGSNRNRVQISDATREYFQSITSQELKISKDFSEFTCKQCESKITEFFNYRNTLLNIQEIWNQTFDHKIKEEEVKFEDQLFTFKEELSPTPSNIIDHFEEGFENFKDPVFDTIDYDDLNDDEEYSPKRKYNKRSSSKMRARNRKAGPFICDFCGQEFDKFLNIKNHIRSHLKDDRVCKFPNCGLRFETNGKLQYHRKRFHKKTPKAIICNRPECKDLVFESVQKLDRHKRKAHYTKFNICCHLCGKSYRMKAHFLEHFNFNHSSERPFACQEEGCEKAFSSKNHLRQHTKYVHGEKLAVQCTVCFKYFKSSDSYRKHRKYHEGEIFVCDYENCGKQFVSRHIMNVHKKIHLNQKDYVCQYAGCSAQYHNRVGLRKHIYSVHQKVRIACEIPGCKSIVTRKEIYRSHVLSIHKDLNEFDLNALLLKIREMKLPKCQYTEEKSQEA